jgi:hypothetical protein
VFGFAGKSKRGSESAMEIVMVAVMVTAMAKGAALKTKGHNVEIVIAEHVLGYGRNLAVGSQSQSQK